MTRNWRTGETTVDDRFSLGALWWCQRTGVAVVVGATMVTDDCAAADAVAMLFDGRLVCSGNCSC